MGKKRSPNKITEKAMNELENGGGAVYKHLKEIINEVLEEIIMEHYTKLKEQLALDKKKWADEIYERELELRLMCDELRCQRYSGRS